jgi:hypothetical protein
MFKLRDFAADTRGDLLKSVAATAAVIAFSCLAMTQLLDRATKDGSLPHIAIVTSPGQDLSQRMAKLPRPLDGGGATEGRYDDTPVASIGGRPMPRIVLDPCSGQQR